MAGFYKPSEQVVSELDAIKKAKEDQELWDKVALNAMSAMMNAPQGKFKHITHKGVISDSFIVADDFMAERAKRMELVIREGQK